MSFWLKCKTNSIYCLYLTEFCKFYLCPLMDILGHTVFALYVCFSVYKKLVHNFRILSDTPFTLYIVLRLFLSWQGQIWRSCFWKKKKAFTVINEVLYLVAKNKFWVVLWIFSSFSHSPFMLTPSNCKPWIWMPFSVNVSCIIWNFFIIFGN